MVKPIYFFAIFLFSLLSCNKKLYMPNENLYLGVYSLSPTYQDSTKWTSQTFNTIQQHVKFLDSLGNHGILLFAGRTKYQIGHKDLTGIMVLKYEKGLDSLKLVMKKDPAVLANVQMQRFHPYSMGVQHFYNLKKK